MSIKKPKNSNYAAIIVDIKTLVPLEKCDFVQAAIILGNQVIVSKDVQVGDVGIYFPLECQLSKEYLSNNNLYRKKELNVDNTKTGYFEENGRIRCVKFRGHKSEGLFMPMESINFRTTDHEEFTLGTEFDEVNGTEICRKYVIVVKNTSGTPGSRTDRKSKKAESKIIDGQFRFHNDTSMLYKNLHNIKPSSLISITYKLHGTSAITSKLLCKKPISWYEKLFKFIGLNIETTHYDYIYSSRTVIKNKELNPNANHYYGEDIWGKASKQLEPFLLNGMTLYYEIVGYLSTGAMIQKNFDYGYVLPSDGSYQLGVHYGIYIYRITYTNDEGNVFEFSAKQVQDWCTKNGLKAVPQLFYGYASELSDERMTEDNWRNKFLQTVKDKYNEKNCYMCMHDVPEEGCVIRVEGINFEAYKQKSNAFYGLETKNLDKGEVDLESEN